MSFEEYLNRALPDDPELRERLLIDRLKRRKRRRRLPKSETQSCDVLLEFEEEATDLTGIDWDEEST